LKQILTRSQPSQDISGAIDDFLSFGKSDVDTKSEVIAGFKVREYHNDHVIAKPLLEGNRHWCSWCFHEQYPSGPAHGTELFHLYAAQCYHSFRPHGTS
jgi:hypothetical protein